MLCDYVRLATHARWDRLIVAGWTDGQIVDQVLAQCRVQFKVSTARPWYREIRKIDTDTIIEIVQFNSAYSVTPRPPPPAEPALAHRDRGHGSESSAPPAQITQRRAALIWTAKLCLQL